MSEFNEKEKDSGAAEESGERKQPVSQPWNGPVSPAQPPTSPHYGTYPPPYSGGGQQGQYYGGPSYQYGTPGWQQQNARQQPPPGRYEWSFQDYDRLAGGTKKKKRSKGLVIFTICIVCLLTFSLVGMAAVGVYNAILIDIPPAPVENSLSEAAVDGFDPEEAGEAAQMELSSRPQSSEVFSDDGQLTTPQIAEKMLPSVVSIENYQQGYFYEPVGLGSGIIMNEEGYIITNQHVIEDADALKVTLNNGEPYEARIIGQDARTDLAVIKIEAEGLIAAEFGDSDSLRVGETVIAIGNPASMELAGSVTQGIVSATNRNITIGTYSMNYIQTDAAINPGNSGGALVNVYGQVIGINSAKIQQVGFEGIGFAIPITEAKVIIDDLTSHGRVTGRVMLGITAQAVDEVDARRYDVPMGLRIVTIDPSSDMGRKGVQSTDIITHIEGERIYTLDDLRTELDKYSVGDTVRLTLYRQISITRGSTYDVSITLIEDMG